MNIIIREYQSSDRKIVLQFLEKLQDYVVGTDPIKRIRRMPGWSENCIKGLLRDIGKQKGKIYLAFDKDKPIGFVSGVVKEQSDENLLEVIPVSLGIVLDLFVEDKYRSKKVGSLLIRKMEDYLKSQGCDSLWVTAFAPNEKAISFYQKNGFVRREIAMLKKIER